MKNWQFWTITLILILQTIIMIHMSVSGIAAKITDVSVNTSQTVWRLQQVNKKLDNISSGFNK